MRFLRFTLLDQLFKATFKVVSVGILVSIFSATSGSGAATALLNWGQVPLIFEENHGQATKEFQFLTRGSGATILIGPSGAEIRLLTENTGSESQPVRQRVGVRLMFQGANHQPRVRGIEPQTGTVNYYYGSDPSRWLAGIPTFGRVAVDELYPGIDLIYYGNQGRLEFDLVLAAGADPGQIKMVFEGADGLRQTDAGELLIDLGREQIKLRPPQVFQQSENGRIEVGARYRLQGDNVALFEVGGYDRLLALVIDPVIDFGSYLGGTGFDAVNGIAVDADGSAIVTGETRSSDFPTLNPLAGSGAAGFRDAFVTKFNPAGDGLIYSTYLGGSEDDIGHAVAVDEAGNAYVTGEAEVGFPVTQGSLQLIGSGNDAFVSKLSPTGTLLYSAVFGGNQPDRSRAIDIATGGVAFIAGDTGSTDFPVTEGAVQLERGGSQDAFVAQLSAAGDALIYASYLGGGSGDSAYGIAMDSQGAAWIVGETSSRGDTAFPTTPGALQTVYGGGLEDGFVAKFNANGTQLLYSTYLGGSSVDRSLAVDVDPAGNAYVTGEAVSSDFPLLNALDDTPGGREAFVAKFASDGQLLFSTFFGGSGSEEGRGIVVDGNGVIHLAGETTSVNLTEVNPLPEAETGDLRNAFVAVMSSEGSSLLFASRLGGGDDEGANAIALDQQGNVYLAGSTESDDFPASGGFQGNLRGGQDGFVVKIGGLVTQIRQLFFAQFGDGDAGGGVRISSLINLYNLSSTAPANVAIEINGDGGDPLTVDLNGQEIPGVLDGLVIPPDGSLSLETDGAGMVQAGSVTVSSDQEVAGVILFRGFGVAGVGASERLQRLRAPITVGSGLNSGLALMDLGDGQTIQLQLRDSSGTAVATASVVLAAGGHLSQFVTDFAWDTAPDFSDFSGTVTATGEGDFTATVILVTASEFATLPVTRLIRN